MHVLTGLLSVQVSSVHHQLRQQDDLRQVTAAMLVAMLIAVGAGAVVTHLRRQGRDFAIGTVVGVLEDLDHAALAIVEFRAGDARYRLPVVDRRHHRLTEGDRIAVDFARTDPTAARVSPPRPARTWWALAALAVSAAACALA